jgi:hypothetical protein
MVNREMNVVIEQAVWPAVLALVVGHPSSVTPRKAWYLHMWRIKQHKRAGARMEEHMAVVLRRRNGM